MSTIYDKTDNYGLNLYGNNDPADLRDGYNDSMRTIDSTLETHLNRIEGVESRETHDEEVVKALIGDNTVDSATTSKTRWDDAAATANTNEGDIATINANLTALHANTVGDAQKLYNQVQSNADSIADMDEGDIILFVGDSIVRGYGASNEAHRFSTLLANKLGLTEVNHSSPGAGFVHISTIDHKTLMDCVNEAIEDDTFDHSKVKYLILEGGINDNNAGDITNAANTIMSKLHGEFTSARRYFMNTLTAGGKTTNTQSYMNAGASGPFVGSIGVVGMFNIISTAQTAAYANMFTPLDCWNWLSFANGFDSDGVHPNDAGHERIADMMYGILGNGVMPPQRRNVSIPSIPSAGEVQSLIDANTINISIENNGVTVNSYKTADTVLPYGQFNIAQVVGNKLIVNVSTIVNITRTDVSGGIFIPLVKMPDKFKFAVTDKNHAANMNNPYSMGLLEFSDDTGTVRHVGVHFVYDLMANVIYAIIWNPGSGYTLTNKNLNFSTTLHMYIPFSYRYL